jgi:hypothetical protein
MLGAVLAASPNALGQQFDLSPGKKVVISDSVFRRGSAVIEVQSLGEFDKLARYIQARPQLEFEIRGHASNEGNYERNLALSRERAEAAKVYLVRVYGVPANRIRTSGVGDAEPLVPNTDEINRAKNRRVEFIGLSGITRRTLTTGNNTAIEADGRLTVVQGRVFIKAPWETDLLAAGTGAPIYEYHRINTDAGSRAEITFKDGSKLQIGESASAIVYSPQKNRPQDKPQETVELIRGDVFVRRQAQNSDSTEISIRTAGKQVRFTSGIGKVGVDSTARATVSMFEGQAQVKEGDSSLADLGENFGFGDNRRMRLPDPPKLMEPDVKLMSLVPLPSPLLFKWMNTSYRTRLEVATSDDFLNPVYRTTTANDSALVKLPPGKYFFRLVSVDSVGLESKNILNPFNIQQLDEAGVRFRIMPYFLFLFGVVCIWVSLLFNTPFQSRYLLSWTVEGNNLSFEFASNSSNEYRFRKFTVNHQVLITTLRSTATLCLLVGLLLLLR